MGLIPAEIQHFVLFMPVNGTYPINIFPLRGWERGVYIALPLTNIPQAKICMQWMPAAGEGGV